MITKLTSYDFPISYHSYTNLPSGEDSKLWNSLFVGKIHWHKNVPTPGFTKDVVQAKTKKTSNICCIQDRVSNLWLSSLRFDGMLKQVNSLLVIFTFSDMWLFGWRQTHVESCGLLFFPSLEAKLPYCAWNNRIWILHLSGTNFALPMRWDTCGARRQ